MNHTDIGSMPIEPTAPDQRLTALATRAHWAWAAAHAAGDYVESADLQRRNVGAWLMDCAAHLVHELADDLDDLANTVPTADKGAA